MANTFRKFLLTINNPEDNNCTHDIIKEILDKENLQYYCMADEIGDNGTYHTHLFILYPHAKKSRCSAIKKLFPTAHIDGCLGTAEEVRNYVLKQGHDDKSHTQVEGTFEESCDWSTIVESKFKRAVNDIISGDKSVFEVIQEDCSLVKQVSNLKQLKAMADYEKYSKECRNIEVIYKYGLSGTGKTSSTFVENPDFSDVYVVQDYNHPFDSYNGQKVIVFEEYRSNFMLTNMLQYLDRYPVQLPARYANQMAQFTKIYVISNILIGDQYSNCDDASRQAFLRRFNKVEYYYDDKIEVCKVRYQAGRYELELESERVNEYSTYYRNKQISVD